MNLDTAQDVAGLVPVSACPHPFKTQRVDHMVPVGMTVAGILDLVQPDPVLLQHAHVFIEGEYVPRAAWSQVRPKAGKNVIVRVVPSGGGGGGGKKNPLKIVLTLAVIAASFYFGPQLGLAMGVGKSAGVAALGLEAGALQSAVGGFAITAVGTLLTNAVAPPSRPKIAGLTSGLTATGRDSPTLFIAGARNQESQFGVIPRLLGMHRIVPPRGARFYTEIVGADQYLRALFCFGYGPITLTQEKIGETLLSSFADVEEEFRRGYQTEQITNKGAWDASGGSFPVVATFGDKYTVSVGGAVGGVTYAAGDIIIFNGLGATGVAASWDIDGDQPLALFPNDVFEESLAVTLKQADGWSQRTTQPLADEVSVDITFPQGLVQFADSGTKQNQTVSVEVESSPTGAATWTTRGTITVTSRSSAAIRRGLRWKTGSRQAYDVRLRRISADTNSTQIFDSVSWTVLRTITNEDPVKKSGMVLKVLRIKATDQLSGVIDQYNAVGQSILRDWDSGSATWIYQPTSSCAAAFREVLQGQANAVRLVDSAVDLLGLQDWHTKCAAAGREFNTVIDYAGSVGTVLDEIAAAGRASRGLKDGKYSIVIDEAQTVPIQHFSPRNSWDFRGTKVFHDLPHGWRVRFVNRDKDWRQDERIVYDDGFDATNATLFEGLELAGVTDPQLIWKDGRYHIATARLRPEKYSFYTDVEHIVCTKGDLVRVTHDVPLWGIAAGRVKAIQTSGSNTIGVTVDEELIMSAAKSYTLRFRGADGVTILSPLVTDPGSKTTVVFVTLIVTTGGPQVGDLAMFGETGAESVELIVNNIQPGPNETARLECLDAAPAVHAADAGVIPAFQSQITDPPDPGIPLFGTPRSNEAVMLEAVDGTFRPRILVPLDGASGQLEAAREIELAYRISGLADAWSRTMVMPQVAEAFLTEVEQTETYEFKGRFITNDGPGDWSPTVTHTVIGTDGLPPDVVGVWREGDFARWDYASPPRDFKGGGFRVRSRAGYSRVWSDATPVFADALITETMVDLTKLLAGTRTLMVKAVDASGNESATAASLIFGLGDPAVANVVETYDLWALAFPGTVTDGSVSGGDLVANDNGTNYLPDAAAQYLTDGSALYLPVTYKPMTYVADFTPSAGAVPADMKLSMAVGGDNWNIEYRTQGDDLYLPNGTTLYLAAGPALYLDGPGPWRNWPVTLPAATRQKYDFRFTTVGGNVQGTCTKFAISLDVPDEVEELSAVAIGAAGTRLPITKSFRSIQAVQDISIRSGSSAIKIEIADYDVIGPMMYAKDKDNALTTATIDATAKGVKGQ